MKKSIITFILTILTQLSAFSQNVITGHITDAATDEPLIGAYIVVKSGKEKGTVTDYEGNFKLATKSKFPLSLSVEYVGYRSQEIDVYDSQEPVEIQLKENPSKINEVVVVGYGTQKRTHLTGSVTTVKADVFSKAQTPTLDQALTGQVAGLNVTAAS